MKIVFGYVKIIATTLLALAIFDQAVRVHDTWNGRLIEDVLVTLGPTEGKSSSYHPFLQYTSAPLFEGWVHHLEPGRLFYVRTNSHGFRSVEFFPPLPGRARVLLLGDSFVYGYNANQNATLSSVINTLAKSDRLSNVDVLSLGVTSYSGLRYAMLSKLYFEYLRPDIIIVALDQSDFMEDFARKKEYDFDSEKCPVILKDADFSRSDSSDKLIAFDDKGEMVTVPKFSRRLRLRLISGLFNRIIGFTQSAAPSIEQDWLKKQEFLSKPPIRYEDLVGANGEDISAVVPNAILRDTIPFGFERAKTEYMATLESLACVKRQADKIGARMYVSSYPYPWFVSSNEAAAYLMEKVPAPLDFTGNRVNPRLARYYSNLIGVTHLDAYPVFEGHAEGMYGNWDPHFSEVGYHRFAEFLYSSIRDHLHAVAGKREHQ